MEEKQIKRYILKKTAERKKWEDFWMSFDKTHLRLQYSESTYREVKAKISSKINACDRSIRDHKKLLSSDINLK